MSAMQGGVTQITRTRVGPATARSTRARLGTKTTTMRRVKVGMCDASTSTEAEAATVSETPTAPPAAAAPKSRPETSDCTSVLEEEGDPVSFGTIGVSVGGFLLVYGFGAFFEYFPGQSVSAPMLIYGFIIALLGSALKYAELKPLNCKTFTDADKLRASQATDIQVQVKNDVTRFRYGDEQHMEEALERIFLFGRRAAGGIARRDSPKLVGLKEQVINGTYALVMVFESEKVDLAGWEGRREKIERFFGPGITCEIYQRGELYDVCLISQGKGGSGKDERPDALPQLMPGLKPRQGR